MKTTGIFTIATLALALASCEQYRNEYPVPQPDPRQELTLREVARILSELPLEGAHLGEVHDAVSSSSGNGYDEEYMMSDLFSSPGAGVGDGGVPSRSGGYGSPLKDLFADYFEARCAATRAGSAVEYIEALSASDMQIYWPYSEDWDGESYPIVTFDPGYGAESNYGYEIRFGGDGVKVVDSVFVDEAVAMTRPVWVINRNDDSAFTPLELLNAAEASCVASAVGCPAPSAAGRMLMIKSFQMLRNYDSWFGGASEFFVKCGAVDGFRATTDEDLKKYSASLTDFMISVKRKQLKLTVPFEAILLSDFTDQIDKLVFLIIEDDGGTTTSWKCSATVKYQSKNYGFDLDIPYHDKDDIVWRGQLSSTFFTETPEVTGRFGDVRVTFKVK
ncbi:MAG: hypothetical protein K6F25_06660 [Bacteroidales bacterium]|nr:hypothetical protein [Bacteroidales bacterium]